MLLFKEYETSAYKIMVPGFKINGLLVRQPIIPGVSELGPKYLLSFSEIGIEQELTHSGDVGAVEAAKKIVRERFATINHLINQV